MALNCPIYLSTETGGLNIYLNRFTGSYPSFRLATNSSLSTVLDAVPKLARPSITAVLEAHRHMAHAMAHPDAYDSGHMPRTRLVAIANEAYAHASALFDSLVDEETYSNYVASSHRAFTPLGDDVSSGSSVATLFDFDMGANRTPRNLQRRMLISLLRVAPLGRKSYGFAADERSRGKAGWLAYAENWIMLMKRFTRIMQTCPSTHNLGGVEPMPMEITNQAFTPTSGSPNRPFNDAAAGLMTPAQFADLVDFICDAALSGNGAFVTGNNSVWPHATPGDHRVVVPMSKTLFAEMGADEEQLTYLPGATYDQPDAGVHTLFRGVVDGRNYCLPTLRNGQYNLVASRMMTALRARIASGLTKREASLGGETLFRDRLVLAGFSAEVAGRIATEMCAYPVLDPVADAIRRYPNTFACNSCGQVVPKSPALDSGTHAFVVGFGFGRVAFPTGRLHEICASCSSVNRIFDVHRLMVRITAKPDVNLFGRPELEASAQDREFDARNVTAHCSANVVPRVDDEPVGNLTIRAGCDCQTVEELQSFCNRTDLAWNIVLVMTTPQTGEVFVTMHTNRSGDEYTPGIDSIVLRKRRTENKFAVVRIMPGRIWAVMGSDGPVYVNANEYTHAYTDPSGLVWRSIDEAASNEPIYLTSEHQSTRFIDRAVGIEFETGTGFPVNNKCDAFLKFMKSKHAHTAAAPWAIKSDGSLASGAVEVVTPPMKGHAIEVGVKAFFDASEKFKFATENYQAGGHIHVEVTDMFDALETLYNNEGRDKLRRVGVVIGYAMAAILKVARDFVSRRRREYHYCSGSPGVRRASPLIQHFMDHFLDGRGMAGLVTDGRAGLEFQYRNTVQGGNSYGGGNRRATNYTMEFRIWPSSNSAARVMARAELSQKMVNWVVGIVTECIQNGCTKEALAAATSKVDHLKSVLPLSDGSGKFDELYNKRCTLIPAITEIFGLSPECAKVLSSIHHQFFGPTYKAFEAGDFSTLKSYGRSEDAKWGSACDTGVEATGSNDITKELAYNDNI